MCRTTCISGAIQSKRTDVLFKFIDSSVWRLISVVRLPLCLSNAFSPFHRKSVHAIKKDGDDMSVLTCVCIGELDGCSVGDFARFHCIGYVREHLFVFPLTMISFGRTFGSLILELCCVDGA